MEGQQVHDRPVWAQYINTQEHRHTNTHMDTHTHIHIQTHRFEEAMLPVRTQTQSWCSLGKSHTSTADHKRGFTVPPAASHYKHWNPDVLWWEKSSQCSKSLPPLLWGIAGIICFKKNNSPWNWMFKSKCRSGDSSVCSLEMKHSSVTSLPLTYKPGDLPKPGPRAHTQCLKGQCVLEC